MSLHQSKNVMQGIFTGCDETHEWMLKWWWSHYSAHNSYPVVFCDLGMSKSARLWCETKGTVLALEFPKDYITPREQIDPHLLKKWEPLYKNATWGARKAWFHKPFVFPHTPFDETIWIDLDAQVKKPLAPLFDTLQKADDGLALCKDTPLRFLLRLELRLLLPKESAYQAGVIAYTKRHQSFKNGSRTVKNTIIFTFQIKTFSIGPFIKSNITSTNSQPTTITSPAIPNFPIPIPL